MTDLITSTIRPLLFALLCSSSALAAGCGGEETSLVTACVPGRAVSCVDQKGCAGTQVCEGGGQGFGTCVCAGAKGETDDQGGMALWSDMGTSMAQDAGVQGKRVVDAGLDAGVSEMDLAMPDAGAASDQGASTDDGPLLAFPGALGYGAKARGGRGGEVVYVTNLKDDGPGSLRAALEDTSGPRTVVFRVAGTIKLDSTIKVSQPFVTIAGQSAPGGGIALRHSGVSGFGSPLMTVSTHDVVIRHVRFRRGPSAEGECCGDNLLLAGARDVMVDHCSLSWSTDESFNAWPAKRVTVQRSMITESLAKASHEEEGMIQSHAFAALVGNASDEVSFVQNLFAHNTGRNPQLTPTQGGTFQVVNNMVVNTCYAMTLGAKGPRARFDVVGNAIVAGKDTCGKGRASVLLSGDVKVYVKDNLTPYRKAGEDEWMATAVFGKEPPASTSLRASTPHTDLAGFSLYQASELAKRLLPDVGATRPKRDDVDTRVIRIVQEGKGDIVDDPSEVGGWPMLEQRGAYPDEDFDGMDDAWERAQGLDPNTPDGKDDRDGDGYTNLEEFLNATEP